MNAAVYAVLLALIQSVPSIAQAIQVEALKDDLTPEQMAALKAARDAAIADYLKATGQN
jgi:hypothetical protein